MNNKESELKIAFFNYVNKDYPELLIKLMDFGELIRDNELLAANCSISHPEETDIDLLKKIINMRLPKNRKRF